MRLRIGCALVGLALAVSTASMALAQSDDDSATATDSTADQSVTAPAIDDSQAPVAALFLQVVDPAEQDVEVSLDAAQLAIHGVTLPGAVVSVEGDLADVDDQGNFVAVTSLDEGANEIEIVASDPDGNQISKTLFISRGD